jgi:CspA family cold shock protein
MASGRVKWFDAAKGYGFIERQGGKDVFVHSSAVEAAGLKSLQEGAEVEFELKEGEKGPEASNLALSSRRAG